MLPEIRYTEIETKRLRYFTMGDPKHPALILLHGYPDNLMIWYKLAPLLAKNYFVLGFDWPGMGESEEWNGGATPLLMAKRLKKIITHFNLEETSILAQDMGGQAALMFAATYPESTRAVFVLNSLLMWNQKTSWEIALLRKFKFNEFAITYFPSVVFRRALQTFMKTSTDLDKDVKNDLWTSFKKQPVRSFIVRMCAAYGAQLQRLSNHYATITCPVHLIWAEHGKHFPINHAYGFKQVCKQTTITCIKDGRHWMVLDKQQQIAELITPH